MFRFIHRDLDALRPFWFNDPALAIRYDRMRGKGVCPMADKAVPKYYYVIVYQTKDGGAYRASHAGYEYEESPEYSLYRLRQKINDLELTGPTYLCVVDQVTLKGTFAGIGLTTLGTISVLGLVANAGKDVHGDVAFNVAVKAIAVRDYEANPDPKASIRQPEIKRV